MSTSNSSGISVGFGSLLFLLFLGLKLTKQIDWSWWWVTAPLWLPAAVGIVILGTVVLITILANKE